MVNKLLNLELPQEVWGIIDKEFKLNKVILKYYVILFETILQSMDYIPIYLALYMVMELRIS